MSGDPYVSKALRLAEEADAAAPEPVGGRDGESLYYRWVAHHPQRSWGELLQRERDQWIAFAAWLSGEQP